MQRASVIPAGALNGQHAGNAPSMCVAGQCEIRVRYDAVFLIFS